MINPAWHDLRLTIDAMREHGKREPAPAAPVRVWHVWLQKTEALRRQAMVEVIRLASCQE